VEERYFGVESDTAGTSWFHKFWSVLSGLALSACPVLLPCWLTFYREGGSEPTGKIRRSYLRICQLIEHVSLLAHRSPSRKGVSQQGRQVS
jgi:hypothetical protein